MRRRARRLRLASIVPLGLVLAAPAVGAAAGPAASADEPVALAEDPRVAQALRLVETWLDAQVAYEQIPGASAAIVHDQDVLWARGFGLADRESGRPATPETIYSICSISKLFTSIALMRLWEEGRVRLDEPVETYLPWFRIEDPFRDDLPVTVERLLTHSGGLPREADFPYWTGPEFAFPTREQVIERLSRQEKLYPSERYFQYSNLGMALAGEIVAAVAGEPYDAYVRRLILDPLGLDATSPEIPDAYAGGRMATGYGAIERDGTRRTLPLFKTEGIAPAAGFASTALDLARFASWQFRLLGGGEREILRASTLRKMQRVHWVDPDWKTFWGLGFSVWRTDETTYVGHGGSCPGYRSQLSLRPKAKIAVVFMANCLGIRPRDFTENVHRIVDPAIAAALAEPGEAKTPPAGFEDYVGTYGASFGGEIAVVPWEDALALLSLPTDEPMEGLTRLRHVEGDTFRRVRDDGELGETVVFERDADGRVVRFVRHSNRYPKRK